MNEMLQIVVAERTSATFGCVADCLGLTLTWPRFTQTYSTK